MKRILTLLLVAFTLSACAQIQNAPPAGSKTYGQTTFIAPDGLLWYGTNPLKYRSVYPKTKVDSLLALIPTFDASLYYTKVASDARFVSLTLTQSVGGVKTFTDGVIANTTANSIQGTSVGGNGGKFTTTSASNNALQVTASTGGTEDGGLANFTGIGGETIQFTRGGKGIFSGYLEGEEIRKTGGTSSQFLKADGSVDANSYQTALTLTTLGTSGAATLIGSTLNIPTPPSTSGFVPYSGATTDVDLGIWGIYAGAAEFSGSYIGGNSALVSNTNAQGRGLYVRGGNTIATDAGSRTALEIDSYATTDIAKFYSDRVVNYVPVEGTSFVRTGGTSAQFLKADGTVDASTYLTSVDISGKANIAGGNAFTGFQSITQTNDVYSFFAGEFSMTNSTSNRSISLNPSGGLIMNTSNTVGATSVLLADNLTLSRQYQYPDAAGTIMVLSGSAPPATSTSTGKTGTVIISGGFRYECVSTNVWVRSAVEVAFP